MTETSISLLSILVGILGAVFLGFLKSNLSLGITANIIIGVFASIFVIKSFGRLGFTPNDIMIHQKVNYFLLGVNLFISIVSGMLGLFVIANIKRKLPN
ncbi:hypothetical protein [Wenyingzhuangia sp. 2_MG-2023]|uniref:hypothetical protein n=1 Tax=Wenyingzhuangia sp. 2_MG-2023 TaxID=3062639 RepID=UPI0026E45748|nr:hypothetical protein [Wenyingzhuangia sp. 2_MG-2023]MDO6738288.1 hypothetical protein [Wenyingzhuangia sp. 2_MG-2023]MDO6802228.1 hypothetical protein [Wenyingzhuangia sp. 1_MG-2023]